MRLLISENAALQMGPERYHQFIRHMKHALSRSKSKPIVEGEEK